jgi:hypothetical protein
VQFFVDRQPCQSIRYAPRKCLCESFRADPKPTAAIFCSCSGPGRRWRTINAATEGAVATQDRDGQTFVEADLAGGTRVVPPAGGSEFDRLVPLNETMSCQIKPCDEEGPPIWDVGVVISMVPRTEAKLPPNRDPQPVRHPIELIHNKSKVAEPSVDWERRSATGR